MSQDCSICFGEITAETGKTVLACKHEFHLKCVVTWLQKEEGAGTCPCCRAAPSEMEQIGLSSSEDEDEDEVADDPDITTLMIAARNDDVAEIRRLIEEEGKDIEERDSEGDTALSYAVSNCSEEAVDELLRLGANVIEIARLAHPNPTEEDITLDKALFAACYYPSATAIQACLDRGANVNARLITGTTPLMEVIMSEEEVQVPAVRLLLERGADIKATDVNGWNVFMWFAQIGGESDVMELLISRLTPSPSCVVAVRLIQEKWRDYQMKKAAKTLSSLKFTVCQTEVASDSWFMSRMMRID